MVDPVKAADGRTYERAAISSWFESGNATSPWTKEELSSTQLVPDTELLERMEATEDFNLSHFLEQFIFDTVFGGINGRSGVSAELVGDLAAIAARRLPDESLDPKFAAGILPSPAGCTGIVRELFAIAAPAEQIDSAVNGEVVLATRQAGYLDVPLAVSFVTVTEERIRASASAQESFDFSAFDFSPLAGLRVKEEGFGGTSSLSCIANIRSKLAAFADYLCKEAEEHVVSAEACASVERALLAASNGVGASLTRSLRMFLLKSIERRKGVSHLRGALLQAPLKEASWLRDWLSAGDIAFTRFVDLVHQSACMLSTVWFMHEFTALHGV